MVTYCFGLIVKQIRAGRLPEAIVKYRIIGDAMQTIAVELSTGDSVFARQGAMLFAKGAVKSEIAPDGAYWSGLLGSIVKEGEPKVVVYRCDSGSGLIGFQAPSPGRVHIVHLEGTSRVIVSRAMILAATEGIMVDPVHLEENCPACRAIFLSPCRAPDGFFFTDPETWWSSRSIARKSWSPTGT